MAPPSWESDTEEEDTGAVIFERSERRSLTYSGYLPYIFQSAEEEGRDGSVHPPSQEDTCSKNDIDGMSSAETALDAERTSWKTVDNERSTWKTDDADFSMRFSFGTTCDDDTLDAQNFGNEEGILGNVHEESPALNIEAAGRIAEVREELSANGITTLMLRNVPASRTQAYLIKELNESGYTDLYDFCYLPRVFKTGLCRGFAFINFVSPEVAAEFKVTWHKTRRLTSKPRDKALDISIAEVQGRDANLAKAASAKMGRIKNCDFRPFVVMDK